MDNRELRARMERRLSICYDNNEENIAGMIKPFVLDCDPNGRSVTFGFPTKSWQLNPMGTIHGGMIATFFDTAMGLAAIGFTDSLMVTIDLHINYLLPALSGGVAAVRCVMGIIGGRIIQARAELFDPEKPHIIIATASSVMKRTGKAPD